MVLLIFIGSLALAAMVMVARVLICASLMADFSETERDLGVVQSSVAEPETHPTWRFEVGVARQGGPTPAHELKG